MGELCSEHRVVVFDTSAIESSDAPKSARREYRDAFFLAQGLVTVNDVVNEAELRFANNYRFMELIRSRRATLDTVQNEYRALFEYVDPQARERGMHLNRFGKEKAFPNTDAKVATLALLLAKTIKNVAFISSDRALNDLLYDQCVDSRLPEKVHPVSIYYFWQTEGTFVPYSLKDRRATYGTPRGAESSCHDKSVPRGAIAPAGA